MKKKNILGLFFVFFAGCALQQPVSKSVLKTSAHSPQEEKVTVETPQPSVTETGSVPTDLSSLDSQAILYAVHPEGDPKDIISVLKKFPDLKLTLIFPPKYFSKIENKNLIAEFKRFVSSQQIEVAMIIDSEPILPLLGQFKLAKGNSTTWNIDYEWPDDIAAQVAQASGRYQKLWGELPSGFVPPYYSLSNQVVSSLKRFRLDWTLGHFSELESVGLYDSVVVLSPPELLQGDSSLIEGSEEWIDHSLNQIKSHSFILFDSRSWVDPKTELEFLLRLGKLSTTMEKTLYPVREWIQSLVDQKMIADLREVPAPDLSAWAQLSKQRVAWAALSEARRAVHAYKNSGQANMSRLDAAFNELYSAQSGPFLLALGQSQVPLSMNEKNFVATLSNVYRLCQTPIPLGLNTIFTKGKFDKPKSLSKDQDRPFFESSSNQFTWNDSLMDDHGGGLYTYAVGSYPKFSFDLKQFQIEWNDDEVVFRIKREGPLPAAQLFLHPVIDIYIDVNRLAGAGSMVCLPQRGQITIQKEAAWEYALTITEKEATLYSPMATGEIRKTSTLTTRHIDTTHFSISIPRRFFRGDPSNWRYSVGLLSAELPVPGKEVVPAQILMTSTNRNFGGASSNKQSPVYIDLLAASSEDQYAPYQVFDRSAKGTLPYIEP